MYQTLLFDLDGTLTDPKEGITKSVQYALAHFGIEEEDLEKLTTFIGPPLTHSFMTYYGLDAAEAEEAVHKYRERFSSVGIFENGVYEGIHELLEALKIQGKVIVLATSKPHLFAEKILKHYGLYSYFDVIVGSELDGTRSHKNEVIEEVFHRLQLTEGQKSETVMIGDRKHDILGAKACGIPSIGVRFGYAEPQELEEAGADHIVNTVEELKTFLLEG